MGAAHPEVDLPPLRPYDLRHTFLTHVYLLTGDLAATQELAGHASPEQTLRYAKRAVSLRAKQAVAAIDLASRAG